MKLLHLEIDAIVGGVGPSSFYPFVITYVFHSLDSLQGLSIAAFFTARREVPSSQARGPEEVDTGDCLQNDSH